MAAVATAACSRKQRRETFDIVQGYRKTRMNINNDCPVVDSIGGVEARRATHTRADADGVDGPNNTEPRRPVSSEQSTDADRQ